MSGQETPGRRSLSQRIIVSSITAIVVIAVGSRINPEVSDAPAGPLACDQILPVVDIDDHSLVTAIASLRTAAHAKLIVNNDQLARVGIDTFTRPDYNAAAYPKQRLTNIRLGTALAMVMKEFAHRRVECCVDRDTITVGASPAPVGRLYDIRDIVADCDKWWGPMPQEQKGGSGGNGYPTAREIAGRMLCRLIDSGVIDVDFQETARGAINWRTTSFAGWLAVDASPSGHRQVERLLALLRRGASADYRLKGATP